MNLNRNKRGMYTSGKTKYSLSIFVLILIIVAVVTSSVINAKKVSVMKASNNTAQVDPNHDAIEKIKDRDNFKKRIENQAKQVLLTEQISDRQAKIDALKAEISKIEGDLEATRKEELGF